MFVLLHFGEENQNIRKYILTWTYRTVTQYISLSWKLLQYFSFSDSFINWGVGLHLQYSPKWLVLFTHSLSVFPVHSFQNSPSVCAGRHGDRWIRWERIISSSWNVAICHRSCNVYQAVFSFVLSSSNPCSCTGIFQCNIITSWRNGAIICCQFLFWWNVTCIPSLPSAEQRPRILWSEMVYDMVTFSSTVGIRLAFSVVMNLGTVSFASYISRQHSVSFIRIVAISQKVLAFNEHLQKSTIITVFFCTLLSAHSSWTICMW